MRAAVLVIGLAGCGDDAVAVPGAIRVGYGEVVRGTVTDPVTYVFGGEAGDWVKAFPVADGDLEITVRDVDVEVVASAGAPFPTRLAETGDHYVELRRDGDAASVAYTFRVQHLRAGETEAIDVEPNDDAATAQSIHPAYDDERADILGVFDGADDVDVYALHVPQDGPGIVYTIFTQGAAHGSTRGPGTAWFTDASGADILGRAAIDAGEFLAPPLLGPADYLLWIAGEDRDGGDNDFYDLSIGPLGERVFEREALGTTGANDSIALADASDDVLPPAPDSVFVIATLPPGDVDYLAIDVTGTGVRLNCKIGDGSGVRALVAELRDSSDASLGAATTLVPFTVAPGRYYLHLTATAHDPDLAGHHVQCSYLLV